MKDWTDISNAIVCGLYQYPTKLKVGINNQHKTDDWATHKLKMKNKRRKNNKHKNH